VPEKIEDAIIREISEESGITDVKNIQIFHIESHYTPEKDEYFVLCIFT
jgi:NADH pyrophosphatase NudC (nudix superfamily)